MGYRNDTQPDPRYFQFGNAFMGGVQQSQDNQRQNAMLDMEKQQFGMQQDRHAMAVDQYGRSLQADQAASQQQQVSRAQYAKAFEEAGLDPGLADTEGADELFEELMKQKINPKQPELMMGADGRMTPKVEGALGYRPPSSQQAPGGDRRAYMEWYLSQPPEIQDEINRANRGYADSDDKAAFARATAEGKGEGERGNTYITEGLDAADGTAVVRRALDLLETVKTGGIDKVKLDIANTFGVTGADEAELSGNLGKAVLSQLRATFGAQFTEREGARLEGIEASFGKSTEGNKRLLNQALQIMDRAARRGLEAAEAAGDTFSANEIRKALDMKLQPVAPKRSGQSTSGPKAGEVVDGYKFKGGDPSKKENWVKQ